MAVLQSNNRRKEWLIFISLYLFTTLNFTVMSIFSPLINRQLRVLNISPFTLGIVGSVFGICQLLSSPFIGYGCKKHGVKIVFFFTLVGTVLNNFTQVFASSLIIFILARSLAGFFKHSAVLGKLLLTQLAQRNEIAWGLGYLGAFSNVGVVIGPSLGAYFVQFLNNDNLDESRSAMKYFVGFVVGVYGLMIIILMELFWNAKANSSFNERTITAEKKDVNFNENSTGSDGAQDERVGQCKKSDSTVPSPSSETNPAKSFNIFNMKFLFQQEPRLCYLFALKFCFIFASHCIRSNFPLTLQRKHLATEYSIGYLNSLQSVVGTAIGFFVSPIIFYAYRNNQRLVILHAGLLQMFSFICQAASANFLFHGIAILILEVANPFLWVSTVALPLELTYSTKSEHLASTGTIIGLGVTISNISLMTAPLCAGLVVFPSSTLIGSNGPALLSALFSFIGVCITWLFIPIKSDADNELKDSPTNINELDKKSR